MQRTLFYLPHDVLGVPLLGIGWLFFILLFAFAFWLFRIYRDPNKNVIAELSENRLIWIVASAAILFILPNVEIRSVAGEPIGVAVRGYGVFLLMGVSSGVALALHRARRAGIPSDDIFGLAMWLFVGGIGGARLFYIIEYRQDFLTGDLLSTARKMLDFTRGGLVVYGSIIGGTLAMFGFVYRTWRLRTAQHTQAGQPTQTFLTSFLKMGDVVAPCLFIGIFFGRIGCLMNGCCYGGRCDDAPWALYFPPGSPVYSEQLASGELLGLKIDPVEDEGAVGGRVVEVEPNSPADQRAIKPGSFLSQIYVARPEPGQLDESLAEDDSSQFNVVAVVDASPQIWTADQLPRHALAVSPAQVISSISGLLICIFLLAISAIFNLPHGVLMTLGFAVYSLARFGEEIIRSDEPGQFGTQFSISQWISMLIFPVAIAAIIYIYWKRPSNKADEENAISGTGVSS